MNPKTIMATSCAALLVMSACGGGSNGDGASAGDDTQAFCDALREADAQGEIDLDEDPDGGLARLREFRADAPPAIQGDIDVLIGKFEELNDLEAASTGDDEEDFAAAFAIILDPAFVEATENVEAFGVDECGLEPTSDDALVNSSEDVVDDGPVEATVSDDGLIREAANVPDPLFDPIFESDVVDPNAVSIDGAAYFFDVNFTDSPWRTRLSSWSSGGSGTDIDFSVGGTDITAAEAAEICSAVAQYVMSLNGAGSIAVNTFTQNDDGTFGDESEVLSGTVTDGC